MKTPKRFQEADLSQFNPEVRDELHFLSDARKTFMIYGPVGTGKTHAAWAVANAVGLDNIKYMNLVEALANLRRSFDLRSGDMFLDFADTAQYGRYLLIDDLGVEKPTEWALETIYGLINHRYEHELPTIFTSNLSLGELSEHLGDRIASRISGMCDVVVKLEGEDKRISNG